MTPEGKEQAQIIRWAESTGFVVLTTSEGRAVWRASGLPDLYLIQPALGLALWWEVKAPKGRLSPTQEQFQALHEAAGRHAEARSVPGCHSGTAEDFGRFLERLGLCVLVNGVPGLLKPRLSQAWKDWRAEQQKRQVKAKIKKAKRRLTPSPRKRR